MAGHMNLSDLISRSPVSSMSMVSFGRRDASPSPVPDDEQPCSETLLNFRPSACPFHLLDHFQRPTAVSMGAQLGGMFFLAECGLNEETSDGPPITHLTCYRRNLFQVSGSITLSQSLKYIVTDQGLRVPITGHELVISASESVEGNAVKLISIPWKSSTTASGSEDPKAEAEPDVIPIEFPVTQTADTSYVAIPFSWNRLQFRIATANNGRRKELQQYFVVRLRLNVILPNGARVGVCDAHSDQIVVRGRSPRNFVTGQHPRKEYAIGGSARRMARHTPSSSISTSTSSSQKSESPATNPLDGLRIGSSAGFQMPSLALAPLHQLENPVSQSPYIYESYAGTNGYTNWAENSGYREYPVSTTPGGSLFSPMAEMALKHSSDTSAGYTSSVSPVSLPAVTGSGYPSMAQQYAYSTATGADNISGYAYAPQSKREWS
ncbi:MAG: hypothetical protein M1814_002107 [Vezdaea aestivalis]|nr:MAG: hypothetical protein M1814_002107 [Vezdaea aestivalis]